MIVVDRVQPETNIGHKPLVSQRETTKFRTHPDGWSPDRARGYLAQSGRPVSGTQ